MEQFFGNLDFFTFLW